MPSLQRPKFTRPKPPRRSFAQSIDREIRRLELGNRIALFEDPSGAIVTRGANSITSRVPYVRLERGRGAYSGRRRRLRFDGGGRRFVLLTRVRRAPALEDRKPDWIGYAADDRGRDLPVFVVDPGSRTIELLVDLEKTEVVEGEPGRIAAALAAILIGRPLELILGKDGPPTAGRRVPARIRALLQRQGGHSRRLLEREIAFLRRLREQSPSPRSLVERRIELVEAALEGRMSRTVELAACEREARRLERLVSSRACASLQVDPERIRGLLNPRLIQESWGVRPLNFSLWPAPDYGRPEIALWEVGTPQPPASQLCLGQATGVLTRMEEKCDVYGLIDTILNLVETTRIGFVRLTGGAPRGGRFPPWFTEI